MAPSSPDRLRAVRKFEDLIAYLKDELHWPLGDENFGDNLTFEYSPHELGLKDEAIAAGTRIRQLRPLKTGQPWGIFFVEFPKKKLPVTVLHRILRSLVIKKRTSSERSKAAAWHREDLLFISAYGDEARGKREIAFGHFHEENGGGPVLRVLAWDDNDTPSKLARLNDTLKRQLAWPGATESTKAWRERWSSAFRYRPEHVIKTSDHMAEVLAGFARRIRQKLLDGLSAETDKGPHHVLLEAFRTSLLHDLEEDDFADTYAQTVTYGLLSVAISRTQAGQQGTVTADHLVSEVPLTSPFLKEMLSELLKRGGRKGGLDYDDLGLHEVVEFLNSDETDLRAIFADFGNKTESEDPVIYFYEHFLTEYDKKLKIDRGVFYTPKEVVSYIVRSVHELLQTEFGLTDGLADTATWAEVAARNKGLIIPASAKPSDRFVTILDPATGTATFLVEVIEVIHRTLVARWTREGHGPEARAELWNAYVPEHLLPRLYGYELLMAPYAIAHLKIGLKLAETGYTFGTPAVVHVFLTNALEPPSERKLAGLGLMALAHEAEAVNDIKRRQCFTVVIGNPPYAGISSNMSESAQKAVDAYRVVDGAALNERKLWLQDDYVKFIRKAQSMIDLTTVGVLGYITNHGYLDNPTFRGMRQSLMRTFQRLCVLDLHGNANKKERSPDGSGDKPVFDIKQGVAICLATRGGANSGVAHAELWGTREVKYSWLAKNSVGSSGFARLTPCSPFYFFQPQSTKYREEYDAGFKVTEAMPCFGLGFQTSRDHLVVGFDQRELEGRIASFISPQRSDASVRSEFFPDKIVADYEAGDTRQWSLSKARRQLQGDANWRERIRPCLYRPFDRRVILYDKRMVDWPRPEVLGHLLHRNLCLLANRQSKEDFAALCAKDIPERKIAAVYDASSSFPLYLYADEDGLKLSAPRRPNFSHAFLRELSARLGVHQSEPYGLPSDLTAEDIFYYAYAVFYSPAYRSRYAEFLKKDFPRVPLTGNPGLFSALARFGGELTALHLLESPKLTQLTTEFIGGPNAEVEKISWSNNTVWIDKAKTRGFRGVGEEVWNFHIGGYQVCEKWVKDRRGRALSNGDIGHYQKVVVALAGTLGLMKEIDGVIESHGGWPGAFQPHKVKARATETVPFLRRVPQPRPEERYVTYLPLVPLKAAAGAFSDPQHIDDDDFEWVAVEARHGLRRGMFVAQIVGKSMEPAIPDGAVCLFAAPVEGTRQGKTVLVRLRDKKDPETGERYTVKRYESEKVPDEESWRHARIKLKPANRDFDAIELTGGEGDLTVIAEFIEVLGKAGTTDRG